MRRGARIVLCALSLTAAPVAAEDSGADLMRKGLELFLDGLQDEMAPGMQALADLMAEAGPSLQQFVEEMGPALSGLLAEVQDWSAYHPPEMLPNGDIIIRRKPPGPADPETEPAPEGQIDL